jgi:IS5 family transposase
VMCSAGHNLRLILAALQLLCARFGVTLQAVITELLVAPGDRRSVWG